MMTGNFDSTNTVSSGQSSTTTGFTIGMMGGSGMMGASGLPLSMIDLMQGVLSGSASGSSSFTGVMQGMLDAMDDLIASPSSTSGVGINAMNTMVGAMENVLSGTAAGTTPAASLTQSMLNTMHDILSGTGQTAPAGYASAGQTATAPSMMLSAGGHVLATTVDRAHVTVSPSAGAFMASEGGTSGQTIQMASGTDTIVATDGQIMLGLNDAVAGPVWHLYEAALGREPDVPGFQGWMAAQQNGMGLQQMAQSFIGSHEFQAKYGALGDAQFVGQLYHNVLGRDPDALGMTTWTDALSHGMGRDVVLIGFANSAENVANTAAHAGADGYWVV